MKFYGRERELDILKSHWLKNSSSLVVVRGRRRIGKSTLVEKFAESAKYFYRFEGLAPIENTLKISQIDHMNALLKRQFSLKKKLDTWLDIFEFISRKVKSDRTVLFFDEISWMGDDDPQFTGYLKIAWDQYFSKYDKLVVVLAGSVSVWIEKNILAHTAFLGRVSTVLSPKQLSLQEIKPFFANEKNLSTYDKLKFLSITGGVPKYINEYKRQKTVQQNLQQMCFEPSGLLFNEFNRIFNDIFGKRTVIYKKIVICCLNKAITFPEICKQLNVAKNGIYLSYVTDLIVSGFITPSPQFNLKTSLVKKGTHYKVTDNYLRFYLKYIDKNKAQIEKGLYRGKLIERLPHFESFLGYQFENLIHNNLDRIYDLLDIPSDIIVSASPVFQKATTRTPRGVQIDLLIQCKPNILYVCEIKFQKFVSNEVYREILNKSKFLKKPKYMTVYQVLIYAGEIGDKFLDQPEIQLISAEDLI